MPATGPRAAERTLVAVRAMVPVTQIPPNSGEAMFATPCATSSQFDRWRRPLMLSATTADSRLSMAPSSAKATASGRTASALSAEKAGSSGSGRELGMPPNRVPIVSTGSPRTQLATAAAPTAISSAGQCGRARRTARISPTVIRVTAAAAGLIVGSASESAISLGTMAPGSLPSRVRPSNSLSWLAKMMTAIPAVNPMVTG